MAKAKKKATREKGVALSDELKRDIMKAVSTLRRRLHIHRLLFLWGAEPVSDEIPFPPDLCLDVENIDHSCEPDWVEAAALSLSKDIDAVMLAEVPLLHMEAVAGVILKENKAKPWAERPAVRIASHNLASLRKSSCTILRACDELRTLMDSPRLHQIAELASVAAYLAGVVTWPDEDTEAPWSYLNHIRAAYDGCKLPVKQTTESNARDTTEPEGGPDVAGSSEASVASQSPDYSSLENTVAELTRAMSTFTDIVKSASGTDDSDTDTKRPLRKTAQEAYAQCTDAMNRNPELRYDKEVYAWLEKNLDEHDDPYKLPKLETWLRYVGMARKYYGRQKATPRAGRERGKSIVKESDI